MVCDDASRFRAGGDDHGGRRHGAPDGCVCRRSGGIYRVRGGLSIVNVLATTFLSGISG